MNNEAEALLNKIQKNRDLKNSEIFLSKINPYPVLLVYKSRRVQLSFAIMIAVALGTFVAQVTISSGRSLGDSSLILLTIGGLMVLVPLTEEWAYTPWQAKPHRFEKLEHE